LDNIDKEYKINLDKIDNPFEDEINYDINGRINPNSARDKSFKSFKNGSDATANRKSDLIVKRTKSKTNFIAENKIKLEHNFSNPSNPKQSMVSNRSNKSATPSP